VRSNVSDNFARKSTILPPIGGRPGSRLVGSGGPRKDSGEFKSTYPSGTGSSGRNTINLKHSTILSSGLRLAEISRFPYNDTPSILGKLDGALDLGPQGSIRGLPHMSLDQFADKYINQKVSKTDLQKNGAYYDKIMSQIKEKREKKKMKTKEDSFEKVGLTRDKNTYIVYKKKEAWMAEWE
jgi:hypothetical protein